MESSENLLAVVNPYKECLTVILPQELNRDLFYGMETQITSAVQMKRFKGIIFDLTAVTVLDGIEFHAIRKLAETTRILGLTPVFSGFKPGMVASLIDQEADIEGITAFLTIEDAIVYFER